MTRASKTIVVAIAIAALAGMFAMSASAQNNPWGNLLGNLIQRAMIDNAVKKWEAVDPDVRQCLANTYSINAAALAQQAITPDDYRLQNQMQYCTQQVAQARYEAEQRQRQMEQDIANARNAWNALNAQIRQCMISRGFDPDQLAQQRVGPDQPRVRDVAQSCQDQIAQEQQRKLQAEARHKNLVARFGADEADDIESGRVAVGMSKDAVREALGAPDNVEKVPPDDELWIYGSKRIAISKGRVTNVE